MFQPKKDKMDNREKFNGFYRGKVVDVEDPYEKGRVKVEVFGVFDGLSPDELPWAILADPFMGGQEELGGFIVPDLDSHVWVFFEEGDHTLPVYFAGAPARPHGPSEATNGDYPRNKVFKTKSGFVFEVDDTEGDTRLRVYQPSGNEYKTNHDGDVEEYIAGDVDKKIDGDVEEHIAGNVDRQMDGDVENTIDGDEQRTIKKSLTVTVTDSVLIDCPKIDLGEPGDLEQSVLGKKLEEWINGELVPWLNSHGHGSAPDGPPGPPVDQFSPGTAAPGSAVWSKKNKNQ